jgi:hypothetical protein
MHSLEEVWIEDSYLCVRFVDGRILASPKSWFPKLMTASNEQLAEFNVSPFGVHWPQLDEDVSVEGLLLGRASRYGL